MGINQLPPFSLTRVTMTIEAPWDPMGANPVSRIKAFPSLFPILSGNFLWRWDLKSVSDTHIRFEGRNGLGVAYLDWSIRPEPTRSIRFQFGLDAYGLVGWIYWFGTWIGHWIVLSLLVRRMGK